MQKNNYFTQSCQEKSKKVSNTGYFCVLCLTLSGLACNPCAKIKMNRIVAAKGSSDSYRNNYAG